MATGLRLKETMSGWISFNEAPEKIPFRLSLHAFTLAVFKISAPRPFKGEAEFRVGEGLMPIEGELVLDLSGPSYCLRIHHEKYGEINIRGRKTYTFKNLKQSLITCPLSVYKNETLIGEAEVVYRDSMLAFPFTALRLVEEEVAYLPYGGFKEA